MNGRHAFDKMHRPPGTAEQAPEALGKAAEAATFSKMKNQGHSNEVASSLAKIYGTLHEILARVDKINQQPLTVGTPLTIAKKENPK